MSSFTKKNQIIINKKINTKNEVFKKKDEEKLINILIRTTYRPTFFKNCIESVFNQKYTNYNIICCYDDLRCLDYLKNYDKINEYFYINIENKDKCFYNLYCNTLMDKVKDGWIMFLDDDDQFSNDYALSIINSKLNNDNDILFWVFKMKNKLIYPKNINNIRPGEICNSTYCFNSKFKNLSRWTTGQEGDFNFINGLLKINIFNRIGIKLPLIISEQPNNGIKENII